MFLRLCAPFIALLVLANAGRVARADENESLAILCAEVTRTNATRAVISARAARVAGQHLLGIARSMRILPHRISGSVVGYRLASIPRAGLARCLGFRRDDVVRAVNDLDLTVPDVVMKNYARLLEQTTLQFSILRKNKPLVLQVSIE